MHQTLTHPKLLARNPKDTYRGQHLHLEWFEKGDRYQPIPVLKVAGLNIRCSSSTEDESNCQNDPALVVFKHICWIETVNLEQDDSLMPGNLLVPQTGINPKPKEPPADFIQS